MKKRSKKLLSVSAFASPEGLSQVSKSFLVLFFKKELLPSPRLFSEIHEDKVDLADPEPHPEGRLAAKRDQGHLVAVHRVALELPITFGPIAPCAAASWYGDCRLSARVRG